MLTRLLICAALALLPSSALAQPAQSGIAPSAAGKSLSVSNVSSCVAMTQQNNSIVVWNVGTVAAYFNVNGATATTGNPQLPAGSAIVLSIGAGASLCAITAASTTTLQITQGFGGSSIAFGGAVTISGGTISGFTAAPTTVTTSAPTATVFSAVLAANTSRKACTVTNIGTTQGYCNAIAAASATTSNTMPVSANGGQFICASTSGPPASTAISCTCASGTCAFVVNEQ